jgi:hypothetical protein
MTIPWVITDPLGEDASSTRTKTGKLLTRMAATKMSRAETQRRKEIFLFFTVKIHPLTLTLPPLGGRGDDFHERG